MVRRYSRKECWEACLSYYKEIFLATEEEAEEICSETSHIVQEELLPLKKRTLREPALAVH